MNDGAVWSPSTSPLTAALKTLAASSTTDASEEQSDDGNSNNKGDPITRKADF